MNKVLKIALLIGLFATCLRGGDFVFHDEINAGLVNSNFIGTLGFSTTNAVYYPYHKAFFGTPGMMSKRKKYFLRQYIMGRKNGKEVCWDDTGVCYVADYVDDRVDGDVELFPMGAILSVKFTVKDDVLNGKCTMLFNPFPYKQDPELRMGSHDVETFKDVALTGPVGILVKSEGVILEGKRHHGTFINVRSVGVSHWEASISSYTNGLLFVTSNSKIYHVPSAYVNVNGIQKEK